MTQVYDSDFSKYARMLAEPFPSNAVKFRVGGRIYRQEGPDGNDVFRAQALCYVDARDVMDRLDDVVGPENWQDTYSMYSGTVVCSLGINVGILMDLELDKVANNGWVWKADGAGATAFEKEKGQISDAFKRAAVRWGVNRAAYKLPAPWVTLEGCRIGQDKKPRGGRIPDREMQRLMAMYENFDFDGAAGPEQDAPTEGEERAPSREPGGQSRQSRPAAPSTPPPSEPPPQREGSAPTGRKITEKMAGRILAISLSRSDELKADALVEDGFHGYRIVQTLLKKMGLRTAPRGAKKPDYIELLVEEVRKPVYDTFCAAVATWKPLAEGTDDGGFSEPPKRREPEPPPADDDFWDGGDGFGDV